MTWHLNIRREDAERAALAALSASSLYVTIRNKVIPTEGRNLNLSNGELTLSFI